MPKAPSLVFLLLLSPFFIFAQSETFTLNGKVLDQNDNPLAYATVGIAHKRIGTVTNKAGEFSLKLSAASDNDTLLISLLGYEPQKLNIAILKPWNRNIIKLIEKPVVLQEVVVKSIDPVQLIRTAIDNIPANYYNNPHITNGFYRIDTKKGDNHIMLSEAVFDIYNYGYDSDRKSRFRLNKMRSIQDEQASHGLDLGLKPRNVFEYYIIKQISGSELFSKSGLKNHQFRLQGIINYNGIEAYEISFDQKDGLKKSLYKGKLYLDVNDLAFISIEFGLSPKGLSHAKFGDAGTRTLMALIGLDVDVLKDNFQVKYSKYGDRWVLAGVRNDNVLNFKSNRAFYDFRADIRVDYVITGVDTAGINEFSDKETLGSNKFIEFQPGNNDKDFWKDYNTILPDYNADTIAARIIASNATYDLKNRIEKIIQKLPKDKSLRIDSLLSFFHQQGIFNGAALIKNNGQVIFQKNYGLADREKNMPVTNTTQFRIGSVTKTFTAAVIQQLINENKIGIADTIGKFIPDHIHSNVTVAQLLTHTSGIPNYTSRNDYLSEIMVKDMTLQEMVRKYCSDSLEFKSGEGFRYSNSGYLVLASIIEMVTGRTYGQAVKERIFDPLGMTHSGFAMDNISSKGYWHDKVEPSYKLGNVAGAGGIISTTEDLLKWDEALYTDKLLPADKIKALFEPRSEYADWDAYYGYGWMIDRKLFSQSKKHTIIYHPGTDIGYYSMFVRQPDSNNLIILLNNTGDFPRFDMADLILDLIN
jgi:CubicO group peptidase (beta-lactamase class C family)